MSNDAPNQTPPPAPPKRRRWFLRLFVLGVVLLLILGVLLVGVQLVLQNTEIARNIALPIVERKLGLRLHAKGLRVSLLGHTELTEVGVSLPLDKADFLTVPAIKVTHGNLLEIILNLGVPLHNIEIDSPTVYVVQDANGEWNLLQVLDILGRLGGSNDPQPTATSGGVPKLPAVHLLDGKLKIADAKGHRADVYPLNVSGEPTPDGLVFKYDLSAGPKDAELLKVGGVVAPGGGWTHEVTAAVGHLDPLARAFGVPSTYAAAANATWDGQLTNGKVGGKLTLQRVTATGVPTLGDVGVTGSVDVTTGGSAAPNPSTASAAATVAGPAPLVTLSPNNLIIATSSATLPVLGVRTGAIFYDDTGLHTRGLKVQALGGAASLDASVDPKSQNVDVSAHWTGLKLASGISQAGSLTASLRQPYPGQPLIRVTLDDRGDIGGTPVTAAAASADRPAAAGTRWDAGVEIVGQGTAFNSIDWILSVPRLDVNSKGTKYDLSGLSAQVQQRPATIDLLGLTLPPAAGAASTTTTVAAPGVTPAAVTTTGGTATKPAAAAALTGSGLRATTGPPADTSAAVAARTGGGSPFGLSFNSTAHVDLADPANNRPLSWRASVSGGLTANYQGTPVPVTLAIDADGNDKLYQLRRFAFTAADANVSATGSYDGSNPAPVNLHVKLTQTPRLSPDAPIQGTYNGDFKVVGLLLDYDPLDDAAELAAAATQPSNAAAIAAGLAPAATEPTTAPAPATGPSTNPIIAAAIASTTAPSTMTAAGPAATTAPASQPVLAGIKRQRFHPSLTTVGDLRTQELVVFGRPLGDIDVQLAGELKTVHPPKTDNGPAAADALPLPSHVVAEVHSTDFALFQAPWDLRVDYPNDDGAAELDLSTHTLPLDVLAKVAGVADGTVAGRLASAHWKVTATGLGLSDVRLVSEYHLSDVSAAGLNVERVDAAASFADGVFKLDPVTAHNGTGTTTVAATYRLDRPTHVLADVHVRQWPQPLGSALGGTTEARANADVTLDLDLANKGANGTAAAAVDVILHPTLGGRSVPQNLAHAQVAAAIRGRTLDLDDVSGRILNGTFKGSAQADVDKPLEAAGRIQWQDVDAGALYPATGNPALLDLGGVFSGTVTIAPSRDPRTLEPVRIDVNVSAKGGHYRSVALGTTQRLYMTHAVAYANIDRAVLDHSDMYVAGGVVHLWGRVGRGLASQSVLVDFNGLSLDQIAHLAPAQVTGPVPGQVMGSLRLIRAGSALTALTGGGHADLVGADLVNLKAIRKLYDVLQASAGGLQPVGRGGADFGLEAGTVRLNSFRFFNRGIDAHGLLTVGPIDQQAVLNSRIAGQVVGTSRLLKGSRLPLFSDFDQISAALQSNLSTINISGTLDAPKIGVATADEIGSQLQQLVTGDAQQDVQAGQ